MPTKLFNRGKRSIDIQVGRNPNGTPIIKTLAPGKGGSFEDETARRLKRLFASELQSLEDAVDEFDSMEETVKAPAVADKQESSFESGVQQSATETPQEQPVEAPTESAATEQEATEENTAPEKGFIGSLTDKLRGSAS